MAGADGKMTGRAGIAFVTRGPGSDQCQRRRPCRLPGLPPMILFVGDVARGDRDREGFQEIDFRRLLWPDLQMGGADRRRPPDPGIYLPRLRVSDRRPAGTGGARAARGHAQDEVEALIGRLFLRARQEPARVPIQALFELLEDAPAPIAIVGGADWSREAAHHFADFAFRYGMPVAAAFRRQDAIEQQVRRLCRPAWLRAQPRAPAARPRGRPDARGRRSPRRSDDRRLHAHHARPSRPDCWFTSIPIPTSLSRVYHADLPICADMGEFAEMVDDWQDPDLVRFYRGEQAHRRMARMVGAEAARRRAARPRTLRRAMRERLPENTIICNGAGNFSGWWHRYWRYGGHADTTRADIGHDGLRRACRGRGGAALQGPAGRLRRGRRRFPDERPGIGDRGAIRRRSAGDHRRQWQRTAPSACTRSGEYPGRVSGTQLANPDFRRARPRVRRHAPRRSTSTEEFAPALDRGAGREKASPHPLQDRRRADHQRHDDRGHPLQESASVLRHGRN